MANNLTLQHKRSSVSGNTPAAGDLAIGELAINFADGKLFTKDGTSTVIELGGSGGGLTISDTAPASPADGDLWYDSLTNFRTYAWSTATSSWLDVAPSNWTTETNGISRADKITVGANADPLVAVDVTGTIGQNVSAGPAIDASAGQVWTINSDFNPTVTITGAIPDSTTLIISVTTIIGMGTVTWPASILWPGGIAPSWSVTGADIVTLFTYDAGITWIGNSFALDAQ